MSFIIRRAGALAKVAGTAAEIAAKEGKTATRVSVKQIHIDSKLTSRSKALNLPLDLSMGRFRTKQIK